MRVGTAEAGDVELLTGSDPSRRSRAGLVVVAVLAVAAVVAGVAVQHHESAAQDRRADAPTLRLLGRLTVQGASYSTSPPLLDLTVIRDDDAAFPRLRVRRLRLAAGALGPVHAIVIGDFIGTGPGPLLADVTPFTTDAVGVEMRLTFTNPPRCGHPIAGDPPLILAVALPSGRIQEVGLRINDVHDPYRNWSAGDPHIPWPQALSEEACSLGRVRAP